MRLRDERCTVILSLSGMGGGPRVFVVSLPNYKYRRDPLNKRLIHQISKKYRRKSINQFVISNRKEVKCPCGRQFRIKKNLYGHLRSCKYLKANTLNEVPTWACHLCPKPYTICKNRIALAKHQRLTHGSKPCVDCGRRFATASTLARHRASTHVNLQCFICGAKSSSKKLMRSHYFTHTRSFQCQKCGQQFSSKRSLKDHLMSLHYGVKLQCSQCAKCYTHRSNLRMHVKTQHSGVSYKCKICGLKGYTRKETLRRHMMRVHGQKLV